MKLWLVILALLASLGGAATAYGDGERFVLATFPDDVSPTLQQIRSQGQQHRYNHMLNLGLVSHRAVWIEIELGKVDRALLLKLTDLQVEGTTLYQADAQGTLLMIQHHSNPLIGSVGLPLPQDPAVRSLVIRIEPRQHLSLSPRFDTAGPLSVALSRMLAMKMLFVAIVLVIAFVSACGYFVFKLDFLVYFGLYGMGMGILLFNYSGLGGIYLAHSSAYLKNAIFVLSHTVTAGFFYAFLMSFVGLREKSPRLHVAFRAGIVYSTLASVLCLLDPGSTQMLVPISGVVSVLLISGAVWSMVKVDSLPTRIYLVSSGIFVGFVTLYILNLAGVTTEYFLFGYELSVGTSVDMAMLLVAVATKARAIEVDRQKSAERTRVALEQSSRLASLGLLAGGVAHEINNPLAIIKVTASNLRYVIESDQKDKALQLDLSDKIEMTVDRISKIVKSLKVLARGKTPDSDLSVLSLREVIDPVLNLTRERFEIGPVEVTTDGWDADVYILGDIVQFSQAIMNLIANAYDVARTETPGWIHVKAIHFERKIRIEVSNSGPKIATDIAVSIFDPFFTTKPIGLGMGLGLSICKAMVESMGGTIELDLAAVHTTFVITLDRAEGLAVPELRLA